MKYSKHSVDEDGWTDWIKPNMQLYKVCCCDCGLVHDFIFEVRDGEVFYKASRDNRATGQARRRKGLKMRETK